MTVSILPYDEDPRVQNQLRAQSNHRHFTFDAKDFPALLEPIVIDHVGVVSSGIEQSPEPESTDPVLTQPEPHIIEVIEERREPAPLPSFERFMELPTELREFIWDLGLRGVVHVANRLGNKFAEYLITPVEIREFLKATNNIERPNFLPPLCRVSKSTQVETIGVYLRGSTFMVASFPDNRLLVDFLRIVPKGYETIRSIHFAFFDCFPGTMKFAQNADLELAVRCTGLHTVKLTFHMSRLTYSLKPNAYDEWQDYPRSIDEIWSFYKIRRPLEM
jgi:hypothetical protein